MAGIQRDAAGREVYAAEVPSKPSYLLASNVAINANSGGAATAGIQNGVYVWDAQWTGAGTLKLQSLGSDGSTWRDVASLAAPGTFAGEIRIGQNATLRLFNANASGGTNYTAVYSSMS